MTSCIYPSLNQIREAHSWKRDYEKFLPLSRYIYRPLGFLLTWFAIRIGMTTEAVSWLSGIVGMVGLLCLMGNTLKVVWIGVALLIFFNLLDCVDGSIARVMKTENPYGKFLDSLLGNMVDFPFFAAVGVLTYKHPYLLKSPSPFDKGSLFWLIVASFCAYFYILLLYIEQLFYTQIAKLENGLLHNTTSYNAGVPDIPSPVFSHNINDPSWKLTLRLIDRNLRVRETHYLLLIIFIFCRAIDIFLIIFVIYYMFHTIMSSIYYIFRVKKLKILYRN
jgi:phosphatidylglycerophosphate synthase